MELRGLIQKMRRIVRRPVGAVPVAGVVCAALLALGAAAGAPARAGEPLSTTQLREFNVASMDKDRAAWAVDQIRAYLATGPDSIYAMLARQLLTRAMMTSNYGAAALAASAETTAMTIPAGRRVFFYGEVADHLLDRGEQLPHAMRFARRALLAVPDDPRAATMLAIARGTMGSAYLANGFPDSARTLLEAALPGHPDSAQVLAALGRTYEKLGQPDRAIRHYVRSLGVYLATDSSAKAPLVALYRKRHGSLVGLDAEIAKAKRASRQSIAFDGRREVRMAPPWTLPTLDGRTVSLADYKGKVVVLDFWGSWCGPCRAELPIFQRVFEAYAPRGVVFLGMNWEQPGQAEERIKRVRDFISKGSYTFPVVLDHESVAVQSYEISGFPTVFIVDPHGTIRFRNVGVADGIETILSDQIDSLLEAK